jgi:hypothetical protein
MTVLKPSKARFSNYALDTFVAPDLSKLTECNIIQMSTYSSQSDHWVSNFLLNSIFRVSVEPKPKQYCIFFLRRAEASFREYEHARFALYDYVNGERERVSVYFEALFHIEDCIAQMWQAFSQSMIFINNVTGKKDRLYERGNGSAYEHLNNLYNISRHAGDNITENSTLPVGLTNEGIVARDANISFEDFKNLLTEIGDWADKLSNPPVTLKKDG